MAMSKNHTNHNQIKKSHRNGFKKPKRQRHSNLKGVDPKFLRNRRRAIKAKIEKRKALGSMAKAINVPNIPQIEAESEEVLGFIPTAKEVKTYPSTFKEQMSTSAKVIELEPHDVQRFAQPVVVKFKAAA